MTPWWPIASAASSCQTAPSGGSSTAVTSSTGAACYTAYNHRFEPHLVRLRDAIGSGAIGDVYQARFFYGNGTARDVRNSAWRDRGLGVIPDLGSHLLDLAMFLFGDVDASLEVWSANRFENRSYDHVIFGANGRPVLELEASLLSWRNTFRADVFGSAGSAHVDGLCKWGPSVYTLRLFIRTMHNRVAPNVESREMSLADAVVLVPLVAVILFLAVYPQFVLKRTTGNLPARSADAALRAGR